MPLTWWTQKLLCINLADRSGSKITIIIAKNSHILQEFPEESWDEKKESYKKQQEMEGELQSIHLCEYLSQHFQLTLFSKFTLLIFMNVSLQPSLHAVLFLLAPEKPRKQNKG